MGKLNSFYSSTQHKKGMIQLPMPDADVKFYPHFFSEGQSVNYFNRLVNEIEWHQEYLTFYGKTIACPRLEAWYGDEGKSYSYSGIIKIPLPWNPLLLEIKNAVDQATGVRFNSVLINYYREGKDSMSWHSDDEPELGKNPTIASVSFGAERIFHFKHKKDKSLKEKILLTNGSFLLMAGVTQHFWKHQIPKTKKKIGGRVNLTFRVIKE